MMDPWSLPESVTIGGKEYHINADFRDILDIIACMSDVEQDIRIRLYVALALFYDDFDEMPESSYEEAAQGLYDFIRCDEEEQGPPPPKTIDWEQDRSMIISEVNKVAGCEIRALPFCHWWTFIAWFNAIGEGQLSTVVSIREKLRKRKRLDKWERDFYKQNRGKINFKTRFTKDEQDFLESLTGKKVK